MSELEDSGKYDSESCDLHQNQTTQGILSGGSPIRRTRAKTYSQYQKGERKRDELGFGFIQRGGSHATKSKETGPFSLLFGHLS